MAVGLGIGFRGGVGERRAFRNPCSVQVREDAAWTQWWSGGEGVELETYLGGWTWRFADGLE